MKNLIAAAVLVIFNIMSIHAQNRIYGTVTDRNGEPLAGVNIREKGTGNGTVSDPDFVNAYPKTHQRIMARYVDAVSSA